MKRLPNNLKIAILVSGEIRNWNAGPCDHLINFRNIIQRDYVNTKVDIYGHTWSHCDIENIKYKELFSGIIVDDISMISDWVCSDILLRGIITGDEKYTRETALDSIINSSIQHYAQITGFMAGLRGIPENYDYVIRVRWDLEYNITRERLDELFLILDEFIKKDVVLLSHKTSLQYLDSPFIRDVVKISIQDNFFILSKPAFQAMKDRSYFEVFDNILRKSHRGDNIPSDHGLWSLYFGFFCRKRNMEMIATLPNIGSILRQHKDTSEIPEINEDLND